MLNRGNIHMQSQQKYKPGEMHKYYEQNNFLPTDASFKSSRQLNDYEKSRKILFSKLKIPQRIFEGAQLIEFGPDTGENTLVYAKWGSKIYVVEPNPSALKVLKENFTQYNYLSNVSCFSNQTVESFTCDDKFDFLSAEGFLYTIQQNIWINKCASLLKDGGLMIMTYMETVGSAYELLLKVIYQYGCELLEDDSVEVAKVLFKQKWDDIPHTRSFHSWYMDVLKNPFVRCNFFYKAGELLDACENKGLQLYSSLPIYEDGLHVAWHKVAEDDFSRHNRTQINIKRATLTYFFGEKCFYAGCSDALLTELTSIVGNIIFLLDEQIDGINSNKLSELISAADRLAYLIQKDLFVQDNIESISAKLAMLRQILLLIAENKGDELISFCQSDKTFIKMWGLPVHVVVFRKENIER